LETDVGCLEAQQNEFPRQVNIVKMVTQTLKPGSAGLGDNFDAFVI